MSDIQMNGVVSEMLHVADLGFTPHLNASWKAEDGAYVDEATDLPGWVFRITSEKGIAPHKLNIRTTGGNPWNAVARGMEAFNALIAKRSKQTDEE